MTTPLTIATGSGPWGICCDATNVYWTDHFAGTVNATPIGGGVTTVLAMGQVKPSAVASDLTNVYWAAADGVYKAPIIPGSATLLAAGSPTSIVVDTTSVYWTDNGSSSNMGMVKSVPIATGSAVTLATGQSAPRGIVTDGTNVYWVTYGTGNVCKAPIVPGATTILASGQNTPSSLVFLPGYVYWGTYMDGTLAGVGTDGTGYLPYETSGYVGINNVQFIPMGLLFSCNTSGPTSTPEPAMVPYIMVISNPFVLPTPLVQATATGLCSDSSNVYWTDTGSGTVSQLPY